MKGEEREDVLQQPDSRTDSSAEAVENTKEVCILQTDGQQPDFTAQQCGGEEQTEEIPAQDLKPLTTAQGVGILALFCVPAVNLIVMLIWAYARRGNESRRSLARAGLILTGIVTAVLILLLGGFVLAVMTGKIIVPHTV